MLEFPPPTLTYRLTGTIAFLRVGVRERLPARGEGGKTFPFARVIVTVALWLLGLLAASSSACAPPAAAKSVAPIRVEKEAPPAGARPLGTLTAVDGKGCGVFGTRGSYEGAIRKLRARARAAGADYVWITSVKEPYADRQCAHLVFTVVGKAYRIAAERRRQVAPYSLPASDRTASSPAEAARPQSLSFSARLTGGGGFAVGFDAFELKYEREGRRLVLLRHPGATPVSVAPEPFELDADWHDWQIVRASGQISISLDQKPVLRYVAKATNPPDFRLVAESLEIRNLSLTAAVCR